MRVKIWKTYKMNAKRNIVATILAAALLVSMTGTAFATYTYIIPDPPTQKICVGEIGTYTLKVNTGVAGEHTIEFDTQNERLHAKLTGPDASTDCTEWGVTGSIKWMAPSAGAYSFTYEVKPLSEITLGDYPMTVTDTGVIKPPSVTATVTASATIVPELPTLALVGIGLIGLIALGRRKE